MQFCDFLAYKNTFLAMRVRRRHRACISINVEIIVLIPTAPNYTNTLRKRTFLVGALLFNTRPLIVEHQLLISGGHSFILGT